MPTKKSASTTRIPENFSGDRPIVLITGGTRRLGLAIAERFASDGHDIVITHRSDAALARTAARRLEAVAGEGRIVVRVERIDLSNITLVEDWARDMARMLPRLDVLVHNASTYNAATLSSIEAGDAITDFTVNALAPVIITKHLAPLLARDKAMVGAAAAAESDVVPMPSSGSAAGAQGSIVTLCDIHALGESGRPRRTHLGYSLSKAALLEATMVMARDLGPSVRVNAVAPGIVEFPASGVEEEQAHQREYIRRVPMGRVGTMNEAAEAVWWLATRATYTTGQVLRIDGGRSIT